ncbi:serine proteinase [Clostridium sp.]|uniref:serine proteinase n=1 Tax=Clostridium sp. TaxID=1506 RepID=UPI003079721E|nr:serine proteinase [Oscillospiraceae bacterium]
MAFSFDDLREKVTDLAQSGVAKSKQLAEIAKLKTSNMGEEDTIKKAYLELGRLYYAERGAAPEGAYAAACGRISQAKAAIETNNARIAELKAQGCVEEAESVTAEPVVEDVPPEEPAPEQEVPETPAEEAAAPEEAPAAPEEPKQDV